MGMFVENDQKKHEECQHGNCVTCQQHSADERDGADAELQNHPCGHDEECAAEFGCDHALFLQIDLLFQAYEVLFFRVVGF